MAGLSISPRFERWAEPAVIVQQYTAIIKVILIILLYGMLNLRGFVLTGVRRGKLTARASTLMGAAAT